MCRLSKDRIQWKKEIRQSVQGSALVVTRKRPRLHVTTLERHEPTGSMMSARRSGGEPLMYVGRNISKVPEFNSDESPICQSKEKVILLLVDG